jgi:hypothetical protein
MNESNKDQESRRSKEEVLESMRQTMPFHLSNNIKPYILEAMDIYAESHHLSTKDKEIENLEKEKELILQQARCWAFEAKTQRNTVNQVGSLLGGIPDWGAIVKGVREKIEKS